MHTFHTVPICFSGNRYREKDHAHKNPLQNPGVLILTGAPAGTTVLVVWEQGCFNTCGCVESDFLQGEQTAYG